MKDLTRQQIDEITNHKNVHGQPNMRPKDSATLIIVDGNPGNHRIVMGRRHMRHKFMPGLFVFPGGRVDKSDGSIPTPDNLHPEVEAKLIAKMKGRSSPRRARALAMAAIRETYEEAGLFIGRKTGFQTNHQHWAAFAERGIAPHIANLRVVARAITPPRRPRRFDAWFFVAFASEIADRLPDGHGPSGELEEICWLGFDEARNLELPRITRTVISELEERLKHDPELDPAVKVPFYYLRGNSFQRDMI